MRDAFVSRLAEYLRHRFSVKLHGWTPAELRRFVNDSIAEAEALGFSTGEHLRRFAEFTVLFGQPLAAVPTPSWVAQTLTAPGLSPAQKLDLIDGYYTFQRAR